MGHFLIFIQPSRDAVFITIICLISVSEKCACVMIVEDYLGAVDMLIIFAPLFIFYEGIGKCVNFF